MATYEAVKRRRASDNLIESRKETETNETSFNLSLNLNMSSSEVTSLKRKCADDDVDSGKKVMRFTPDSERDWQCRMPLMKERLLYLFKNNLFSDVDFVVYEKNDSGEEEIATIPAHRFILSLRSPVFFSIFNEDNASHSTKKEHTTIEIRSVGIAAFLNLLEFLYTDNVSLNIETFIPTFLAAKMYAVVPLKSACQSYLEQNVTGEKACMILSRTNLYENPEIVRKCLRIIDLYAMEAISSDSFLEIDHKKLCAILRGDSLAVHEFNLYESVVKWAEAECNRRNMESTPINQKKILGKAVSLIRYPRMKVEEFSKGPVQSGLLSSKKITQMLFYFASNQKSFVPFSLTARKMQTVDRFTSPKLLKKGWIHNNQGDCLKFKVNRKVYIIGFFFFGSIGTVGDYTVFIRVTDTTSEKICGSVVTTFSSSGSKQQIKVILSDLIEVMPNTVHNAFFEIKGPPSYYAINGKENVVKGLTTFEFFETKSNYRCLSKSSPIPKILYYT